MEEYEPLKEQLKYWKVRVAATGQAPPLVIDILLDISKMKPDQALFISHPVSGKKMRISQDSLTGQDTTGRPIPKTRILLETWQLAQS